MIYNYFTFGLQIQSGIELPELLDSNVSKIPDVKIAIGDVPSNLINVQQKGVAFETSPNEFLLDLIGIAKFYVKDGNQIIISPKKNSQWQDIRVFLLGSCLGAILHQRKILAMHASAILHKGKAVLFTGISGAGKSTTANAFRLKGYKMLTDDVRPIKIINGQPHALPGYPHSRLWEDALEKLEVDFEKLQYTRNGINKRILPIINDFVRNPMPIKAMYILQLHNRNEIELMPVEDANKFRLVKNMTYRNYIVKEDTEILPYHFMNVSQLANSIPIKRLFRPKNSNAISELVETIQSDLANQ